MSGEGGAGALLGFTFGRGCRRGLGNQSHGRFGRIRLATSAAIHSSYSAFESFRAKSSRWSRSISLSRSAFLVSPLKVIARSSKDAPRPPSSFSRPFATSIRSWCLFSWISAFLIAVILGSVFGTALSFAGRVVFVTMFLFFKFVCEGLAAIIRSHQPRSGDVGRSRVSAFTQRRGQPIIMRRSCAGMVERSLPKDEKPFLRAPFTPRSKERPSSTASSNHSDREHCCLSNAVTSTGFVLGEQFHPRGWGCSRSNLVPSDIACSVTVCPFRLASIRAFSTAYPCRNRSKCFWSHHRPAHGRTAEQLCFAEYRLFQRQPTTRRPDGGRISNLRLNRNNVRHDLVPPMQ